MELVFQSPKLEKQCENDKSRNKAFGAERAKRLKTRLSALLAAPHLEALRHAPGRLHLLRGDRAGQFSLDLDGPYRLIFEPVMDTERQDPSGRSDGVLWDRITRVRILSIENTHD